MMGDGISGMLLLVWKHYRLIYRDHKEHIAVFWTRHRLAFLTLLVIFPYAAVVLPALLARSLSDNTPLSMSAVAVELLMAVLISLECGLFIKTSNKHFVCAELKRLPLPPIHWRLLSVIDQIACHPFLGYLVLSALWFIVNQDTGTELMAAIKAVTLLVSVYVVGFYLKMFLINGFLRTLVYFLTIFIAVQYGLLAFVVVAMQALFLRIINQSKSFWPSRSLYGYLMGRGKLGLAYTYVLVTIGFTSASSQPKLLISTLYFSGCMLISVGLSKLVYAFKEDKRGVQHVHGAGRLLRWKVVQVYVLIAIPAVFLYFWINFFYSSDSLAQMQILFFIAAVTSLVSPVCGRKVAILAQAVLWVIHLMIEIS